MRNSIAVLGTALFFGLTACHETNKITKPVLSQAAFFAAAKHCGASKPVYTYRAGNRANEDGPSLPSIGVTEQRADEASVGRRPVDCVARQIAAYQFQQIEITVDSSDGMAKS